MILRSLEDWRLNDANQRDPEIPALATESMSKGAGGRLSKGLLRILFVAMLLLFGAVSSLGWGVVRYCPFLSNVLVLLPASSRAQWLPALFDHLESTELVVSQLVDHATLRDDPELLDEFVKPFFERRYESPAIYAALTRALALRRSGEFARLRIFVGMLGTHSHKWNGSNLADRLLDECDRKIESGRWEFLDNVLYGLRELSECCPLNESHLQRIIPILRIENESGHGAAVDLLTRATFSRNANIQANREQLLDRSSVRQFRGKAVDSLVRWNPGLQFVVTKIS